MREALPYSYQSWIVVYILQDSTGKINIFLPDLTIFLPPPAPCICLQQGEFRAPECGSLLAAVTCRLFSSMPPAAPFLPAAEEMGERTPPKTHGLWNSFRPISMRWEKVPQGIDREPTLAAADMVGGGYWRDYRFRRLSNRALAAVSGKCRCGLMGRHFTLVEQSAAMRDVGAAGI